MPVFAYKCEDCENEWDEIILKGRDDEKQIRCRKCGSERTTRLIGGGGIGFRLYGAGFHNRSHKDTGDFAD